MLMSETPSFAFRPACRRARISERKPYEIASPAASSEALLILIPDEIRSTDWLRRSWFTPKSLWALVEAMLLKIRIAIVILHD
jgi:hypothetical protein